MIEMIRYATDRAGVFLGRTCLKKSRFDAAVPVLHVQRQPPGDIAAGFRFFNPDSGFFEKGVHGFNRAAADIQTKVDFIDRTGNGAACNTGFQTFGLNAGFQKMVQQYRKSGCGVAFGLAFSSRLSRIGKEQMNHSAHCGFRSMHGHADAGSQKGVCLNWLRFVNIQASSGNMK